MLPVGAAVHAWAASPAMVRDAGSPSEHNGHVQCDEMPIESPHARAPPSCRQVVLGLEWNVALWPLGCETFEQPLAYNDVAMARVGRGWMCGVDLAGALHTLCMLGLLPCSHSPSLLGRARGGGHWCSRLAGLAPHACCPTQPMRALLARLPMPRRHDF